MQEVDFEAALEVLRRGEILIYPTDTVYGLGVSISRGEAIERLYREKGRDSSKAVSVLVASLEQLKPLVLKLSDKLLNLLNKFLPGPMTLVVHASAQVDPRLHGRSGWIGIRMSPHPLAQRLVREVGPITTTSANPSGEPSAIRLSQLQTYYGSRSDLFLLSGGDLPPSKGSTVIKVSEQGIDLIREGDIPFSEIESEFDSR